MCELCSKATGKLNHLSSAVSQSQRGLTKPLNAAWPRTTTRIFLNSKFHKKKISAKSCSNNKELCKAGDSNSVTTKGHHTNAHSNCVVCNNRFEVLSQLDEQHIEKLC